MLIHKIQRKHFHGPVYNIGVKGDESYVVEGVKVKNCRGIWVAIKLDEAELPPIGGVPKAIRDRFGDAVNDLIQPKRPVVRKDAPAAAEAKRRIEKQDGQ